MNCKTIFTMLVGFGTAIVHSVAAEPLEIGSRAPSPSVVNQDGEPVDLAEAYKKGLVLVYFYPKADTPGCTAQACSLRDSFAELQDKGVTVFGVSMDSPEDQKSFQAKYDLPFDLIADTDGKLCEGFGVPRRGNFPSRQAFLVEDGSIKWLDYKASTKKQAADVLAVISSK